MQKPSLWARQREIARRRHNRSMHWSDLLTRHDNVATTSAFRAAGCLTGLIHRRVHSGRWQRVLPGVVDAHSGPVTRQQQRRAALLWAGDRAVLSHGSAATIRGLRVTETSVETAGYIVLRFPVRRLRIDPTAVVAELRAVVLQRAS